MDVFSIASIILMVMLAVVCCLSCTLTAIQCGCFGMCASAIKKVGVGCWLFIQMVLVIGIFTFFVICIEDALMKM